MPNFVLAQSKIDRQNILNNPYAVAEIEKATGFRGIPFGGELKFTINQVATIFETDERTIKRYLQNHPDELNFNGYEVLRGKRLKEFKLATERSDVGDINVPNKSPSLGVFNFRALLNLAMLLTESHKAQVLRGIILDIAIDTINQKTGGSTKYINQRDEDFITSYFFNENYRKEFTNALNDFIEMGQAKYPIYTNKVYTSIFRENADEYRQILKLESNDKTRDTMYSEVLDLISSYEYGLAILLKDEFNKKGRKLFPHEVDALFEHFASQPLYKPLVDKARIKMASFDLAFRDALHHKIKEYLGPVSTKDFERFLGEKSKELSERLEDAKDTFKRLKNRD
jgi:hypothetical protein